MADNSSGNSKKTTKTSYKNTFEAIKGLGASIGQNAKDEFKKIGQGFFDQLTGNYDEEEDSIDRFKEETIGKKPAPQKESTVFNFQEYHENSIVRRQIQELTEQIKREIDCVKKADKSLMSEIKDIEKLTMESLPEKPGIYHVRFLEVILSILKLVKAKINESGTWLQAMRSRRKKRGSLFAARTKEKGTQYSLADELKIARQSG